MYKNNNGNGCGTKRGPLPACAPLAAAYTPIQENDPELYSTGEALPRGTLFPGLDLPFLNKINKTNPCAGTPKGELMAIDFGIKELNLYLDTHADDAEVFEMLQSLIRLRDEGMKKYIRLYGPLTVNDLLNESTFTWLSAPWPWEYSEGGDR